MMYKILPDAKVAWRDVWIGAAVTAWLFTIGKLLIGLYLAKSSVASVYGAAGSLVIILLWVYYSSQILLLGAEFTQVYANQFGSRIRPTANATAVNAEERAQQGMEPRKGLAPAARSRAR
jgi:membrane protein